MSNHHKHNGDNSIYEVSTFPAKMKARYNMKNKEISKKSVDYNGAEFLLTEEEYEKYSAHVKQQAELFLKPYLESFIDGKPLDECEEPFTFTDVVEIAICVQKNAITMLMLDYPEVQISELESGGDYIDNEEDIMGLADLLPFGHVHADDYRSGTVDISEAKEANRRSDISRLETAFEYLVDHDII